VSRARGRRRSLAARRYVARCERLGGVACSNPYGRFWRSWARRGWPLLKVEPLDFGKAVLVDEVMFNVEGYRGQVEAGEWVKDRLTKPLDLSSPLTPGTFAEPCPFDTNGDGDCGGPLCPYCGGGPGW